MQGATILIIDDDLQLATMLGELLRLEHYVVEHAGSGEAGLRRLRDESPDLVLLDVMLPGMDGFETLTQLRATTAVPVIMLTARGEDADRIDGLSGGADDYLPKPFNPRELLLRISAVLKRTGAATPADEQRLGALRLDRRAGRATAGDSPLPLTETELRLLDALLRASPEVVTRDKLSRAALARPATPFDRALDTHVSKLRLKLAGADAAVQIRSVRGTGYRLLPEDGTEST